VTTTSRRWWLALGALVLAAVLWSLNGPLIKLLEASGMTGVTIACARSLIGGVLFLPLSLPHVRTLRNAHVAWPIGSVAMFTLMTACFVIATTKTFAANAIILQYTSALWVFLLSPLLLREYPTRREGAVLALAMLGVLVIFLGHPTGAVPWLVVALGSGLGYGALTVTLRGLRLVHPLVVTGMNALLSGLILLPAVAWRGSFELTEQQWLLVLLMSVVQFTIPYVLFTWALQHIAAYQAALIVLIEALLNPLWTFLTVGELPPPATLLGGPLILASVAGWVLLTARSGAQLRRALLKSSGTSQAGETPTPPI